MKNLILIAVLFTSLSGCTNNENESRQIQESSIIGTWKLIEKYGSDGGSDPQWNTVEDGYVYTFKNNDIIISNRFNCNGSYTLSSSNQVTITFDCSDSQFNLVYDYTFENRKLILTNLSNCDEGCGEKYEKIE